MDSRPRYAKFAFDEFGWPAGTADLKFTELHKEVDPKDKDRKGPDKDNIERVVVHVEDFVIGELEVEQKMEIETKSKPQKMPLKDGEMQALMDTLADGSVGFDSDIFKGVLQFSINAAFLVNVKSWL